MHYHYLARATSARFPTERPESVAPSTSSVAHELTSDHESVLAAVSQNGRALRFAALHLKDDREIVLAAVARNELDIDVVCADKVASEDHNYIGTIELDEDSAQRNFQESASVVSKRIRIFREPFKAR